jgi:hypothetical protein
MQAADMLETVRTCVNDLGLKNAAVRDVLAEAEEARMGYAWFAR